MPKLVVVESPAKAKTIKKYLGDDYKVVASMGHIRDLPKSKFGVDIEHDFKPEYVNIKGKEQLIKELKSEAEECDAVLLATDPDREGEAISWHLACILGLDTDSSNRVTFNEITQSAVKSGIKNARPIDMSLVDAQQARRVLDRIVGYKISPFLWKKIKRGLSAGRVQSVATRLVVEREREIRNFVSEEYWTIEAHLKEPGQPTVFAAKFYGTADKKLALKNKEQTDEVLKKLEGAAFKVLSIITSSKTRSPSPPFITSTLQQEASRRYGFNVKRTMQIAQSLYEGVDVENFGTVGLITYMRTDSLRISEEIRQSASEYIINKYGREYCEPRVFKSKAGAQDAHEAIRPTMMTLEPEKVKSSLTSDQYKIYKLIWDRFVASQMAQAKLEVVNVDVEAAGYIFKASGTKVVFPGFMALYDEAKDESEEESAKLPNLKEQDVLALQNLQPKQNFTQPPARFTEATLVKALEEKGIGRPSTYAPIITTILERQYIERDGKSLVPTALGEVTTDLMTSHFESIVDYQFTASMEDELDGIANGDENWVSVVRRFYTDFESLLHKAETELEGVHIKIPDEPSDIVCELCGRNMVIKTGRFGKFLACPGYPECKNTKPLMQATGAICPKCGGKIFIKKSKKGKKYYGCEHNPSCDFMTWDIPQKEPCPNCGGLLLKKPFRGGAVYCAKGCGYEKGRSKKSEG